uniref:Uncharacterized protein n=1 Tax=Micrurus lemniscatus lemniscatus TaxID=129467 RepID=A0A2D4HW17_MICLE
MIHKCSYQKWCLNPSLYMLEEHCFFYINYQNFSMHYSKQELARGQDLAPRQIWQVKKNPSSKINIGTEYFLYKNCFYFFFREFQNNNSDNKYLYSYTSFTSFHYFILFVVIVHIALFKKKLQLIMLGSYK